LRHNIVRPLIGRTKDVVPLGIDHLDGHQLHVEGDPGGSAAVGHIAQSVRGIVGQLADRAADMRAVAVQIDRQVVAPDEIERRHEPRRGLQLGRGDKLQREIAERWIFVPLIVAELVRVKQDRGAGIGDAAVQDGNDNGRTGGRLEVPGAVDIDQRQIPLKWIVAIVWSEPGPHPVGGLRVLDVGALAEERGDRFGILIRVDGDNIEVGVGGASGE
jgi:hypothetical protein